MALVFSFLAGWNDVLFASMPTAPETRTIAVQLQVFSLAQERGSTATLCPINGGADGQCAACRGPVYDLPALFDWGTDRWRSQRLNVAYEPQQRTLDGAHGTALMAKRWTPSSGYRGGVTICTISRRYRVVRLLRSVQRRRCPVRHC